MNKKFLLVFLILVIVVVAITIYVVNDQKVILPLDRLNNLDADIVYEFKTENWYAKIVVVYDPKKFTDSTYFTKNFFYLEYVGDERIFVESKPLKYTWRLNYQETGGETYLTDKLGISPVTTGMPIDMYPDKATLEINLDGRMETYELLRQE